MAQFAFKHVLKLCAVLFGVLFWTQVSHADKIDNNSHLLLKIATVETVDEAVGVITSELEGQGYEIVLVVDHAAAAQSVDLELRPTQVILARQPKIIEKRFLADQTTVGIDLPVKFLVYEDSEGDIQLRFNSLGYISDRHQLSANWSAWTYRQVTEQFDTPPNGLVTLQSSRSLSETADALTTAISSNPAFRIPLVLDYRFNRFVAGPILVVFGNPNAGTPLMQDSQEIALDLPQKMLIWKRQGNVFITYNDPFVIAARHNIVGQDMRLGAISNALANFAQAAAGN